MLTPLLLHVALLVAQDPAPAAKAPQKIPRAHSLMVGDLAPKIDIETWIKGEPVPSELPRGSVYLVDFWAKWCGPCIRSMPHLSKLQDQHEKAGLSVLSITTEDTRGNTLDAVKTFVEGKKEDMRFRVAWDRKQQTYRAWMSAAGRNTIPSAFLVNREGRIAFIGNPSGLGSVLEEVLAGKFDVDAAARAYAEAAANEAVKREAEQHAKTILARIKPAQLRRDWPAVLAGYDEVIAMGPDYHRYIVHRFSTILVRMKDPAQAYAYALDVSGGLAKDQHDLLCKMARLILDSPGIENRDHSIALALALQADELTEGKNAHYAETLSRACHSLGDLEGAVEAARRAVMNAPENMRARYKQMLTRYEAQLEKAR